MISFIVGMFVGCTFGFIAFALCGTGAREDAERHAYDAGVEHGYAVCRAVMKRAPAERESEAVS